MKKIYNAPVANKVELENKDVIATSFQVSASKQEGLGTTVGWNEGQSV